MPGHEKIAARDAGHADQKNGGRPLLLPLEKQHFLDESIRCMQVQMYSIEASLAQVATPPSACGDDAKPLSGSLLKTLPPLQLQDVLASPLSLSHAPEAVPHDATAMTLSRVLQKLKLLEEQQCLDLWRGTASPLLQPPENAAASPREGNSQASAGTAAMVSSIPTDEDDLFAWIDEGAQLPSALPAEKLLGPHHHHSAVEVSKEQLEAVARVVAAVVESRRANGQWCSDAFQRLLQLLRHAESLLTSAETAAKRYGNDHSLTLGERIAAALSSAPSPPALLSSAEASAEACNPTSAPSPSEKMSLADVMKLDRQNRLRFTALQQRWVAAKEQYCSHVQKWNGALSEAALRLNEMELRYASGGGGGEKR